MSLSWWNHGVPLPQSVLSNPLLRPVLSNPAAVSAQQSSCSQCSAIKLQPSAEQSCCSQCSAIMLQSVLSNHLLQSVLSNHLLQSVLSNHLLQPVLSNHLLLLPLWHSMHLCCCCLSGTACTSAVVASLAQHAPLLLLPLRHSMHLCCCCLSGTACTSAVVAYGHVAQHASLLQPLLMCSQCSATLIAEIENSVNKLG